MALTISNLKFDVRGARNAVYGTIDFDSSYATGGEALTAANVGLAAIDTIDIRAKNGYVFEYDYTNSKVLAYRAPLQTHGHDLLVIGGQAAASTSAVSVVTAVTLGKEAAGNTTVAKADVATKGGVSSETLAAAALSEVGSAVDLSAVTSVRFEAVGY